jgi:hypothetical protein
MTDCELESLGLLERLPDVGSFVWSVARMQNTQQRGLLDYSSSAQAPTRFPASWYHNIIMLEGPAACARRAISRDLIS